jgi:glycerol-3-phosphate acyltransferase PlsY
LAGTLLTVVLSYLLGAIPTSAVAGRIAGTDLRHQGSGNLGSTNVFRVLGPKYGVPVLLIDVAKGATVVLAIAPLLSVASPLGPTGVRLLAGLAAIIGHVWSCFTGFKGGKGVATAAGVFLALSPFATLAGLIVWLAVFLSTRYVSIGSMSAAIVLPFAVAVEAGARGLPQSLALVVVAVVISLFVLVMHRSNIARLMNGSESRFHRRSKRER